MSEIPASRKAFAALLSLPDGAVDLGQAALLIARDEYPDLDVGRYLSLLDGMADELRARLRGGEGFTSKVAHLNRLLFDEMDFRGNRLEYDDPRNSFLNDVLDRRLGIPISLSTVYLEVARRIGLPLAGVSFPGHFLVRSMGPGPVDDVLIDPFNRGALLTEPECRRMLNEIFSGQVAFRPEFLKRARRRDIVARMIYNLRAGYERQRDYHRALRMQQFLLCIDPGGPVPRRDRGLLYHRLACFGEAVEDLRAYLEAAPDAPDAPAIRTRVAELSRLAPRMN